ncbi:MAG TPA: nuclear transport factor 2 family protein [Sphingomicrobium sp.]|nr:nuclear transport factor 2 family protein [Sphingomicrobium sp.]
MKRYLLVVLVSSVLVAFYALWAANKPRAEAAASPDRAYLQKIWDGWATLDPANMGQFYASGPHTFFDIAPLKYSNWDEYRQNVGKVLADFTSAKFTVNDDADVHPGGSTSWATATVKEEMTHKNGKVDMGNFRWTVVFEKEAGKWLIIHEHVSVPVG